MRITRRVFLGLLGAAARSPAATLQRSPYLQNVTGDRATIMWTTLEPGAGWVEFSSDKAYGRRADATVRQFLPSDTRLPFTFYQYQAALAPLRANIEYVYRVVV